MIFITSRPGCPSGQDVEMIRSQLFLGDLVFPCILIYLLICDQSSTVMELLGPTVFFMPVAAACCSWQVLPIAVHSPYTALQWMPLNSSDLPFDSHVVTKWVFHASQLRHVTRHTFLRILWEQLPPHLQRLGSCASSAARHSRCLKLVRRNSCLYSFLIY